MEPALEDALPREAPPDVVGVPPLLLPFVPVPVPPLPVPLPVPPPPLPVAYTKPDWSWLSDSPPGSVSPLGLEESCAFHDSM